MCPPGDLRIVLAKARQRQQLAAAPGLHGAIAELDDRDALPGEQPGFFGVRDQEEQYVTCATTGTITGN
jgi:hypothetical protein